MTLSLRRPRALVLTLCACLSGLGTVQSVQAAMIGTEAVARVAAPEVAAADGQAARERALATLDREEVARGLVERGVSVEAARERVRALSDAEALAFADRLDQDPAGASDIIGTLVFLFVLLLVTDILGFTKVFPFTRSIR
jgi:hypothetical protein